jgi:predicted RNase H-like HicB family nuclease
MRYSVFLEPVQEAGFEGFYYAHIPTLDLTTHGPGIEGALSAARELVGVWLAEKRSHREPVPVEQNVFISHIEVPDAVPAP